MILFIVQVMMKMGYYKPVKVDYSQGILAMIYGMFSSFSRTTYTESPPIALDV